MQTHCGAGADGPATGRRIVRCGRWTALVLAGMLSGPAWADGHPSPVVWDDPGIDQRPEESGRCPLRPWVVDPVVERAQRAKDSLDRTIDALTTPSSLLTPAPGLRLADDRGMMPRRMIVLVHGLDDTGRTFDPLLERLGDASGNRSATASIGIGVFEYPNDQAIGESARMFAAVLDDLHRAGVERVDIIGHSMGGLVALDATWLLTEPVHLGQIITMGTPYEGSVMAHLRPISELREHVLRWKRTPGARWTDLVGGLDDGDGQAGRDLLPGSEYFLLREPMPAALTGHGPGVTAVLGRPLGDPPEACDRSWWNPARWTNRAWAGCVDFVGDGAVPDGSALAAPTEDVVVVTAWHGLIAGHPQTISVVLERLGLGEVRR